MESALAVGDSVVICLVISSSKTGVLVGTSVVGVYTVVCLVTSS